jgi:DNA-directed RNA polymerase specialized sigma24 family protein
MPDPTRGAEFPSTHWSVLKPGGSPEATRRSGLEALARLYWRPVYAHLRLKWTLPRDEAEDATQDFFVWLLDAPMLDRAEPGHGRFRNFVRTHLDNFVRNRNRAARRDKRGGGAPVLSLDLGPDPESVLAPAGELPPEQALDRAWERAVLDEAVARLRRSLEAENRAPVFEAFRRYDLAPGHDRPSYTDLARELGAAPHDIDNWLSQARRRLYGFVREIVSESVDDADALAQELDELFPR